MAVDISRQLNTIRESLSGETVLENVADASQILVNEAYDADISGELLTIRKGTYGRDIRYAIIDALYKLSIAPGGGGDSRPKTKMVRIYQGGAIQGTVVNMEVVE